RAAPLRGAEPRRGAAEDPRAGALRLVLRRRRGDAALRSESLARALGEGTQLALRDGGPAGGGRRGVAGPQEDEHGALAPVQRLPVLGRGLGARRPEARPGREEEGPRPE